MALSNNFNKIFLNEFLKYGYRWKDSLTILRGDPL